MSWCDGPCFRHLQMMYLVHLRLSLEVYTRCVFVVIERSADVGRENENRLRKLDIVLSGICPEGDRHQASEENIWIAG